MSKNTYEPSADEMLDAYSRMSDEQRELSAVREAHMSADPRIAELPSDLSYRTTDNVTSISGTFGGEAYSLSSHNYTGETAGKIDGKKIRKRKAKKLFETLAPAVVSFDAMLQDEKATSERVKLEKEESEAKLAEALLGAETKGETAGRVKVILGEKLEEEIKPFFRLSPEDMQFLEDIQKKVIRLLQTRTDESDGSGSSSPIASVEAFPIGESSDEREISQRTRLLSSFLEQDTRYYPASQGQSPSREESWSSYYTVFPDLRIFVAEKHNPEGTSRIAKVTLMRDDRFIEDAYTSGYQGDEQPSRHLAA